MKKPTVTALAVLASLNLFAQGTIGFANGTGSRVHVGTIGDASTYAHAGSTYQVGLYWAPLGTTLDSSYAMVGSAVSFAGAAGTRTGIFNGGSRTIPGITPGGIVLVQVRGWETALGGNYETVLAAGGEVGKSATLTVDTGDPTITPPATPISLPASGLAPFAIVPEPSAIALGVLAAGALLMLRRRK